MDCDAGLTRVLSAQWKASEKSRPRSGGKAWAFVPQLCPVGGWELPQDEGHPSSKAEATFLSKQRTELPYDPAIPLLGIYPKEVTSVS
jgi:hypothetical protein